MSFTIDRVTSFERYGSVVARLNKVLEGLNNSTENVLVGHGGYTGDHVTIITGRKNAMLNRGKYIVLEKQGKLWQPVVAQEGAIQ